MDLIVHRGAEGILEAACRIGGEIDRHRGAVRDGPGDFDVEHDLGVRAVGRGGPVVGIVDEDRADRRVFQIQVAEILLQVRRPEAAAQLDDADRLPVAVGIPWEVIQ
jgi:hypothetical protein